MKKNMGLFLENIQKHFANYCLEMETENELRHSDEVCHSFSENN